MRDLTLALAAAAVLAIPGAAAADGGYVGLGVGPVVRLDDWPSQFRVEEEIGYYVDGEPRGFYLSFAPSQSWGADWWVLVFPLRLGASLDIFRTSDVSFQVGPTGSLGVALNNEFSGSLDPVVWFHLSFALMLRLLVADDRLAITLQPVGFEFAFSDTGTRYGVEAIRFVGVFGIQYYF